MKASRPRIRELWKKVVAPWDALNVADDSPLSLVDTLLRYLPIATALVLVLLTVFLSVRGAAGVPDSYWSQVGPSCARGYQEQLGKCVPVRIPPHAFLNPLGDSWECARGYQPEGGACVAVRVPRHAHHTDYSFGKGWECDPGYQDDGYNCLYARVPPHAYPSYESFGRGWECAQSAGAGMCCGDNTAASLPHCRRARLGMRTWLPEAE